MQVALIGALCPEPELLILDEPTSGLDPLVRREFIRTIIGAYQDADPGNRTEFAVAVNRGASPPMTKAGPSRRPSSPMISSGRRARSSS
jgi:hypothetical protein